MDAYDTTAMSFAFSYSFFGRRVEPTAQTAMSGRNLTTSYRSAAEAKPFAPNIPATVERNPEGVLAKMIQPKKRSISLHQSPSLTQSRRKARS